MNSWMFLTDFAELSVGLKIDKIKRLEKLNASFSLKMKSFSKFQIIN